MKFEGRDSGGGFSPGSFDEDEFAAFMLLLFYMGKMDSRLPAASLWISICTPDVSQLERAGAALSESA
jgi:hypothetical protein